MWAVSDRPPFAKGDPRARELGRLGGRVSAEIRRRKKASDPMTRGLLGHLIGLTTSDWMDRLGLTAPSWDGWRVVGKVLDGLPLSESELRLYGSLSGRETVPAAEGLRELWLICGRGSGKTTFLVVQALRAAMRGYPIRGIPRVLLMSLVLDQAAIAFEYLTEFVDGDPELRKLVSRRSRTSLTFAHGVEARVIRSSYRQVRGYNVAAALCDEVAHWWQEDTAANPAEEILRSLRPGLGKVPGSRLLVATTPWTQEGPVFETFTRYWGKDADDAA